MSSTVDSACMTIRMNLRQIVTAHPSLPGPLKPQGHDTNLTVLRSTSTQYPFAPPEAQTLKTVTSVGREVPSEISRSWMTLTSSITPHGSGVGRGEPFFIQEWSLVSIKPLSIYHLSWGLGTKTLFSPFIPLDAISLGPAFMIVVASGHSDGPW